MKMEYYRIGGYLFTLSMHLGNTLVSKQMLRDPKIFADPDIRNMASMEDSYFTIWNIFLQLLYASFGLYCDVRSLLGHEPHNKWASYLKYRKTFFCAILWPSTLFVLTAFWPLFYYDRSIIFPKFVDKVVSKTGNFIIHAGIVPCVIWEMTFLPIDEPKCHKKNLALTSAEFFIYLAWILYTNSIRKLWPYPILDMLEGTIYFPLFFACAYGIFILHYFSHWKIRSFVWRTKSIKLS